MNKKFKRYLSMNKKYLISLIIIIIAIGTVVAILVSSSDIATRIGMKLREPWPPLKIPTSRQTLTPALSRLYDYDVVVVGASAGGISAAIQARRLGASVALIEESDYIGGQMITVPTMDDLGGLLTESGIYREFISRAENYYRQKNKTTAVCYFYKKGGWAGTHCYEPSVVKNILTSMLNEAGVKIFLKNKVQEVIQSGNKIKGIITDNGKFNARIVIDATEYGDVIVLSSLNYRVGNTNRTILNPAACIQDITYTAAIKKYPLGVPANIDLRGKNAPPPFYIPQYNSATGNFDWVPQTYEDAKIKFSNIVKKGGAGWPGPYPKNFITHNAYRAVPDSSNPEDYSSLEPEKITKTFVNWANDYPGLDPYTLSIKYLTDKIFRERVICEAKLMTIHFLYYIQDPQGLDEPLWAIANDEGYATEWNTIANSCENIPSEFKAIENNMPPYPYTRESIRGVGIYTLTAKDIKNNRSPDKSLNFAQSIGLGIYNTDLHRCAANENLESDMGETRDDITSWGRHQIPFESLIPENLDGFILAGKNISQSRLANGSTRVHPTEMVIGQAAGVIAALSIKNNIEPRNLSRISVQWKLLEGGSEISLFKFQDVPVTNVFWRDVQLVTTKGLMRGYNNNTFGVNDSLRREAAALIFAKLANLEVDPAPSTPTFQDVPKTNPFYKYIEAVAKAGIVGGCSEAPKLFCPSSPLTREQFAKMWGNSLILANKLNLSEALTNQIFIDVPSTNSFFQYINLMYQKGITSGCGSSSEGPKFCPSANISRGQTAALLAQTLYKMIDK